MPDHFVCFGLFRNLYEGGIIGEGMVKRLRKLCPSGVRDGWSRNMMSNFYRERSMAGLLFDANAGIETDLDRSQLCELDVDPSPFW